MGCYSLRVSHSFRYYYSSSFAIVVAVIATSSLFSVIIASASFVVTATDYSACSSVLKVNLGWCLFGIHLGSFVVGIGYFPWTFILLNCFELLAVNLVTFEVLLPFYFLVLLNSDQTGLMICRPISRRISLGLLSSQATAAEQLQQVESEAEPVFEHCPWRVLRTYWLYSRPTAAIALVPVNSWSWRHFTTVALVAAPAAVLVVAVGPAEVRTAWSRRSFAAEVAAAVTEGQHCPNSCHRT